MKAKCGNKIVKQCLSSVDIQCLYTGYSIFMVVWCGNPSQASSTDTPPKSYIVGSYNDDIGRRNILCIKHTVEGKWIGSVCDHKAFYTCIYFS